MGPILLVDKSTVQGLSPQEIIFMHKHYMVVIAPILMRELLSNLAKEMKNKEEVERRLSALADKVGMYDSKVVADARSIAASSLLGDEMPMDGRIPMANGTRVRSKDGRMGVIFDEPREKKVLREWQNGKFTADEKELAKQVRKIDLEVDLNSIKERISKDLSHFPKFANLKELIDWIDQTFLPLTDQYSHLTSAAMAVLGPEETKEVIARWEQAGKPLFSNFAPYAHYFYRCNVIYYLGLGLGFISPSKKEKTHLDIQYFYYLPFCMVFTSGDNFLREMFTFFKRDNQFFLWKDNLKKDLIAIRSHWEGMTDEQKKRFSVEFGDYPPDIPGLVTGELWKNLMRHKPKEVNLGPKLSKEQEKDLIDRIMSLYSGAVRIEDNKSVDSSFTDKFKDKGLRERSWLLLEKCVQVFGLNRGKTWVDVKREISGKEVKDIYDFYAELWRPDTDWLKLLAPSPNKSRVLYLGEVDPNYIIQHVLAATLYFDQICIVDPFINPWTMTEEYNPISHPNQFQADLLKIVYLLIFLWPWIETEQVVFIPDPSNLSLLLKKDILEIAQARKKTWRLTPEEEKEAEKLSRLQEDNLLRFIRTLPEAHQRQMLKDKMTPNEIDAFVQIGFKMRAEDPLAIDRSLNKEDGGQLFLSRSGANLELSLLLCQLLGAVPFTALLVRANEYRKLKVPPPHRWSEFCELFNNSQFYFLDLVDASFAQFLKGNGFLNEFRTFLRTFLSRLNRDEPSSDSEVDALAKELPRQINQMQQEWAGLQKAMEEMKDLELGYAFREGCFVIDIDDKGYNSPEIDTLRAKHFPSLGGLPYPCMFFHLKS